MTDQEKRLWYAFLSKLPLTVNGQKVIGPYIADFCCCEKKLIIEIDGSQHGKPENMEYDIKRTAYLEKLGYTVIRYSNESVDHRFVGVCSDILCHLGIREKYR